MRGSARTSATCRGTGWYERDKNPRGALLPTEITEFTNAGMIVGLATVNIAPDPFTIVQRLLGCLLDVRLVQLPEVRRDASLQPARAGLRAQGRARCSGWRVTRGPETAEDSRTHFGIYEPGVTQLFPEGKVIDLHPWEFNEVPVVLAAALATDVPIVALHLTRPAIELPDREALGMPSHFEAARGAYVLRPFRAGSPADGHRRSSRARRRPRTSSRRSPSSTRVVST